VRFDDSDPFRVALIWSSSTWDETRSLPLDLFESAFRDIPGVSFYSLQHGPDHVRATGRNWLHYTGEQSSDILDTAADLTHADLLISVDTMAVHLAGALARPVWVLLKHDADWRWMLDRRDSPWYPTMRLFRQPAPGDWAAAVREIAAELRMGVSARNSNRSRGFNCATG
jgi:hypothetical protein